jgi:hypothetical protein
MFRGRIFSARGFASFPVPRAPYSNISNDFPQKILLNQAADFR